MSVRTALKADFATEPRLDTHPETRLDFDQVRLAAQERYDRPFLLVDPQIVRTKARRFKAAMPRVHPHYAVKANPHPAVLRTLIEEGVGFEIASTAELDLLLGLGVPAEEIYYSNPVKSRSYIEYAAAQRRALVRAGQRRGAAQDRRDQARRLPVPAHRRAQRGQRLAAVGQVRRAAAGGRGDHRAGRAS